MTFKSIIHKIDNPRLSELYKLYFLDNYKISSTDTNKEMLVREIYEHLECPIFVVHARHTKYKVKLKGFNSLIELPCSSGHINYVDIDPNTVEYVIYEDYFNRNKDFVAIYAESWMYKYLNFNVETVVFNMDVERDTCIRESKLQSFMLFLLENNLWDSVEVTGNMEHFLSKLDEQCGVVSKIIAERTTVRAGLINSYLHDICDKLKDYYLQHAIVINFEPTFNFNSFKKFMLDIPYTKETYITNLALLNAVCGYNLDKNQLDIVTDNIKKLFKY